MKLDRTDIAILRCLQEDARRSLREIAKEVGVSAPTVAARLATLEQLGIVKGYRAVLDPARLNETTVALLIKARLPAVEAIARKLSGFDAVRRVMVARGGRILVDATVAGDRDLDRLLDRVGTLPEIVELDHYVGVRTLKEEPSARLTDDLRASLVCFQCKKPIEGEPIRLRLDGRDHFVCCTSCERLYREKYRKIKSAA